MELSKSCNDEACHPRIKSAVGHRFNSLDYGWSDQINQLSYPCIKMTLPDKLLAKKVEKTIPHFAQLIHLLNQRILRVYSNNRRILNIVWQKGFL